jgi:hypothetical protein
VGSTKPACFEVDGVVLPDLEQATAQVLHFCAAHLQRPGVFPPAEGGEPDSTTGPAKLVRRF